MGKDIQTNPRLEAVADLIEQSVSPKKIMEVTGVGRTEVMVGYRWFRLFSRRGYRKMGAKERAS